MNEDVLQYFDATAPEVPDEIEVADGRFSIAVVTAGTGSIDADVRSVASLRSQILVCGICGQATTLSQRGQGCVINPAKVGEHKEGGPGACEACPGHVLVRAMRSDSPTRRWHDLGDALPSFARRPGSAYIKSTGADSAPLTSRLLWRTCTRACVSSPPGPGTGRV